MRVGTVEGEIKKMFTPYNCDISADSLPEITQTIVDDLILKITMKNSNTGVKVPVAKVAAPKRRTFVGGASSNTQQMNFVEGGEEALSAAIAEVRNDDVDCDWAIASFDTSSKPPRLQLKSKGEAVLSASSEAKRV